MERHKSVGDAIEKHHNTSPDCAIVSLHSSFYLDYFATLIKQNFARRLTCVITTCCDHYWLIIILSISNAKLFILQYKKIKHDTYTRRSKHSKLFNRPFLSTSCFPSLLNYIVSSVFYYILYYS